MQSQNHNSKTQSQTLPMNKGKTNPNGPCRKSMSRNVALFHHFFQFPLQRSPGHARANLLKILNPKFFFLPANWIACF